VVLLLTCIIIKRKQHRADTHAQAGGELVNWLNSRMLRPVSPSAELIRTYVTALRDAEKRGLAGKRRLRYVLSQVNQLQPAQDAPEGFRLSTSLRVDIRPSGSGFEFKLVPEDMDGIYLFAWRELLDSGNAARLRRCPNCEKYWYCVGRSDKGFCSDACKVSFWQKSAKGKEAKKQYMRRYRAVQREQLKSSVLTAKRCKIASGILANLGK